MDKQLFQVGDEAMLTRGARHYEKRQKVSGQTVRIDRTRFRPPSLYMAAVAMTLGWPTDGPWYDVTVLSSGLRGTVHQRNLEKPSRAKGSWDRVEQIAGYRPDREEVPTP